MSELEPRNPPGNPTDAGSVAALPTSSTRRCGDYGGVTDHGKPCRQALPPERSRCPYHPEGTPEAVEAARVAFRFVGQETRARNVANTPDIKNPDFTDTTKIIKWCQVVAGMVLRGELTDLRRVDMSVKVARLALDALGVGSLAQLDQLERLIRSRMAGAA